MSEQELLERYGRVREAVDRAAKDSGRNASDVRLLCVSKFHPVEDMLTLFAAGQPIFGENYVQEALGKAEVFREHGVDPKSAIHLIGHIQSRKAAMIAGSFSLIHSLDTQKLAAALERRLAALAIHQAVLIEVNIGEETQKSGVSARDLTAFADYMLESCPHLDLEGLMCLPPVFDDGEAARPFFAKLRTLRDSLRTHTGLPLPELSMGMSGDFVQAVEEGATIVRIGTAVFGLRPPKSGKV